MTTLRTVCFFALFSCLFADISLSFGASSGYLEQDIGHSRIIRTDNLPVLTIAADSYPVGLFGDHDFTQLGITLYPEIYYQDLLSPHTNNTYLQFFPIYFAYYYRMEDFSIGIGINLSLGQYRYKNFVIPVSQREGYQLFGRWHQADGFWELSYSTLKATCEWEDGLSHYYLGQMALKYGIYL